MSKLSTNVVLNATRRHRKTLLAKARTGTAKARFLKIGDVYHVAIETTVKTGPYAGIKLTVLGPAHQPAPLLGGSTHGQREGSPRDRRLAARPA